MEFEFFKASLQGNTAPTDLPDLQALWYAGKGHWHQAHELVQDSTTRDGYWVHAYLHRVEGDTGNAGYWYARAGQPFCHLSLDAEWESITRELLARRQ